MYIKYFKRLTDVVLSLTAIIVLSPVMLISALMARIKLGSPVLFKQRRVGKNERVFTLYKLRTMTDRRDESGNLLPDDVRLTKFGNFLRRSSLDELPSLLNILKGDMSVVGPRPLLEIYLDYYTEEEKKRHLLRPGLTGWAQVNGRNFVLWADKLKMDVYYYEHCTFLLDVKIIFKTAWNLFAKRDVVSGDTVRVGDQIMRPLHIERADKVHKGG